MDDGEEDEMEEENEDVEVPMTSEDQKVPNFQTVFTMWRLNILRRLADEQRMGLSMATAVDVDDDGVGFANAGTRRRTDDNDVGGKMMAGKKDAVAEVKVEDQLQVEVSSSSSSSSTPPAAQASSFSSSSLSSPSPQKKSRSYVTSSSSSSLPPPPRRLTSYTVADILK